MDKKRVIIGGILALAGVILARTESIPLNIGKGIIYIIGVISGIMGLGIIASGLSKRVVKMKICPSCFTPNPMEADNCSKCSKAI